MRSSKWELGYSAWLSFSFFRGSERFTSRAPYRVWPVWRCEAPLLRFACFAWPRASETEDILVSTGDPQRAPGAASIYIAIGISGLTALGAEVIWTRLLSLMLGATVYTFSIILAVFLLGLWAGSSAGAFLGRRTAHPQVALAAYQFLLAAAIAWTGYTLSHSSPYWPIDPWLSLDPWFNFEIDLMRC